MRGSTSEPLKVATNLLKIRDRSEQELRFRLSKRGFGAEEIDKTINRLRNYGYINDRKLAERLVEYGRREKHLGTRGVVNLLYKRGIPEEIIEALNLDDPDEVQRAEEFIKKKSVSLMRLPVDKRKRRIYGYLSRRGYAPWIIKEVISTIEKEDI